MQDIVERPATYADLEAVPPHLVAEIIDGELVTHPRPAPRYGSASNALGAILTNAFQFRVGGPGGWVFIVEPELHFGDDVVVPDLAGWRRERLPQLPDTAYVETAPDWVCEVISPSTERRDRGDKRRIYAQAGVGHIWLLDPTPQVLEIFQLRDGQWLLLNAFTGHDDVKAEPFEAITFPMGLLWPFDVQPSPDA